MHTNKIFPRGSLLVYTLFFLVVTLPFQSTIQIFNSPLRLSTSDFFLPFLLLISFLSIITHQLSYPVWRMEWLPAWFLIFSGWLGISLLQGYLNSGVISTWALINKFFGWFILVGYFFSGGIFGLLDKNIQRMIISCLLIISGLISLCSLIVCSLYHFAHIKSSFCIDEISGRIYGFLENPNAFAYFCTFTFFLQLAFVKIKTPFSPIVYYMSAALNLIAIFCSCSRGALLAIFAGACTFIIRKKTILPLFLGTCLIILFTTLFFKSNISDRYLASEKSHIFNKERLQWKDFTVQDRIHIMKQAYHWWKESPIMGIGLGGFLEREEEREEREGKSSSSSEQIIHNTLVWILTEMGLIGLGLILLLACSSFKVVFEAYRACENPFAKSGLAIMIAFAVGSLTSEIMYQRYLWFLLGFLLVQSPIIKRNRKEEGNIIFRRVKVFN